MLDAQQSTNFARESLLQQEIKQQQIKSSAQRIAFQLRTILEELERNQIDGQDVQFLHDIRGILGLLSEREMSQVIQILQSARNAADDQTSRQNLASAFAGQKTILLQLNQLMFEYLNQQKLYEIARRLHELSTQQTVNMRQGVWLANETENKSLKAFSDAQRSSLSIQQIEQTSLRDQTRQTLAELEKLGKELQEGPNADRPRTALQRAKSGGVEPALTTATEELKDQNLRLLSAIGHQKKARDELRDIARLLLLNQDPTEALRQALREIDDAIDDQQIVLQDTKLIKDHDEAVRAEYRQAEVVDATHLTQQDLQSLAPTTSDLLGKALDRMQEARAQLAPRNQNIKKRRDAALPEESAALQNLQLARRDLEEQLAQLEKQNEQPENNLAALRDLGQDLQNLIQEQQQLKTDTAQSQPKDLPQKAPLQGSLQDRASALQQRAASKSPPAAQSMGEAASQMKQAQNSMAASQQNPAAQQAALDALDRAQQQLAQEIAQLEQAEKDLAQLEELLAKLKRIIHQEQELLMQTAQEAARPQSTPLEPLAQLQASLSQQTASLHAEALKPVPKAATHLGHAKVHMDKAQSQLTEKKPDYAQTEEEEALDRLQMARREIEKRMEQLRQQLGMPMGGDQASLPDASALIEKAQREVNDALSQLQQSPPGLMESLLQRQQQIAEALSEMSGNSPTFQSLAQSHKNAQQAAQQLAKSQLPAAIEAMKKTRGALESTIQNDLKSLPPPEPGTPPLPTLSKQQAEVQQIAESLLAAQQAAPAKALQNAARSLSQAGNTIGPLTAGQMGSLPQAAQSALQSAQESLASGSAQAEAGQSVPAQGDATAAAEALAQAQAALAMAQAGLGSQMAGQGQPKQGQGQMPGQGQGQGQSPGQGQGQSQGNPGPQGSGRDGNWTGQGGANGTRRDAEGLGTFTSLPMRDRNALRQSQGEKYPQEYGPLVEQYLKNLSDQPKQ